jgi:hypothetical protein
MRTQLLAAVVVAAVVSTSGPGAVAGVTSFTFSGGGVSGSGSRTYETNTVAGDPAGSFAITGISGTFSDANIGLSDLAITGLVLIDPVSPYKGTAVPRELQLDRRHEPSHAGRGDLV